MYSYIYGGGLLPLALCGKILDQTGTLSAGTLSLQIKAKQKHLIAGIASAVCQRIHGSLDGYTDLLVVSLPSQIAQFLGFNEPVEVKVVTQTHPGSRHGKKLIKPIDGVEKAH